MSQSVSKNSENGVSAVVGVLILAVVVLILSASVFLTATTLIGSQPKDMTAGTSLDRVTVYEYQADLVTSGNTQTVHVVSPLGTHYKLTDAGDSAKILAVEYNQSREGIGRLRVQGYNEESANSEAQLLESQKVENGINPGYIVAKDGTGDYTSIQTAINNAPNATAENPFTIVVERNTYTENIDVSQNITLIAEHGTVIQDANPNEPVVHVTGENSKVQNFIVDADPSENDGHYGSHGIRVGGTNAEVIGNTVRNSSSPDLQSSGIAVNAKYAFVQYNSVDSSERSLTLMKQSGSPVVCGNQFNSSIGGYASKQTKEDLAMNNYWENGVPTNLVPKNVSDNLNVSELGANNLLRAASTRVPADMLPADSRAGQPFPGTKLTATSSSGCQVNVKLVNTGGNFSLANIKVQIEGNRTTTVQQQESITITGQQMAERRGETVSICDCGGDAEYNPGDSITVYEPSQTSTESENKVSMNDSDKMYAQPLNLLNEGNPEPTDYSLTVPTGSGPDLGGGGPDLSNSYAVSTAVASDTKEAQTAASIDQTVEEVKFTVELGDTITMTQGDKVTLIPVVNGAEGDVVYDWSLGDNTTSSARVVEHIYPTAGTYTVHLTVTDTATGETDSDTVEVTVNQGSKDVKVIQNQENNELITGEEGQTLYLTSGTYDQISDIRTDDLTIVGREDGVVFPNHISVYSDDVSFRNIQFKNGISVYNNNFKVYGSTITNTNGYGVEVNADGNGLYIGNNGITAETGIYANIDSGVDISDNAVDVSGDKGVVIGKRMEDVSLTDNTITASNYGIYVEHATTFTATANTITADDRIYKVPNKKPSVDEINAGATLAGIPTAFTAETSDPQLDAIPSVTWGMEGRTISADRGEQVTHTFSSTGEHTVTVTAKDAFGATDTKSKTFTFEKPTIGITTSDKVSTSDKVQVRVTTNVPDHRIKSVEYFWGTGESERSASLEESTTYSTTGTYTIKTKLTTDSGYTMTTTRDIEVTNSPVANFYLDEASKYRYIGEPMTFDAGSFSSVPGGVELTYDWNINGHSYQGAKVTHTFTEFGTHDISLTVNGPNDVATASITKTLQIDDAKINMSASNPGAGANMHVDVNTSAEGYNAIDEYRVDWDGDGYVDNTYSDDKFTHVYNTVGKKTFQVNAYDSTTDSIFTTTETVTVKEAPSFDFSAGDTQHTSSGTTSFTVSNVNVSTENRTITWDFGDGATATGQLERSNHYGSVGTYDASVTITNGNGIERTKTITVDVDEDTSGGGGGGCWGFCW